LTLCTLLCKDPLLNEPGVNKIHKDMNNYNEIIEYSNLNIAVCDIAAKKPSVFMDFFNYFYPFIKENFNKNYDKWIEYAEKKRDDFNNEVVQLKTDYYGMNVTIDYVKIIEKLKETKSIIEML